jgi:hypothetical protein
MGGGCLESSFKSCYTVNEFTRGPTNQTLGASVINWITTYQNNLSKVIFLRQARNRRQSTASLEPLTPGCKIVPCQYDHQMDIFISRSNCIVVLRCCSHPNGIRSLRVLTVTYYRRLYYSHTFLDTFGSQEERCAHSHLEGTTGVQMNPGFTLSRNRGASKLLTLPSSK